MTATADLWETIRGLWPGDHGPVGRLLPRDAASLDAFWPQLRGYVAAAPRRLQGTIDPAAIVRGEIVSMGPDSVIEAGAVIDATCRLVLGAGCRVRAGAVLRDEVVIGDHCLIGAYCEIARSILLGPRTDLGHHASVLDSVIGSDVNVAGNFFTANTMLKRGDTVRMKFAGERIPTSRTYFGTLVGHGVRFGGSTTVCPGTVVMPGLRLPPGVVLYGTIDEARRQTLLRRFFELWDTSD